VIAVTLALHSSTATQEGSLNRMHFLCNQLHEHFRFQNREIAVHPLPLLSIKTNMGSYEI
jgi:hypothetical protein